MTEEYEESTMVYLPDNSVPSARHVAAPLSVQAKALQFNEHQLLLTGPAEDFAAAQDVVVDALPYIDSQYNDPEVQAQVERMIEREMNKSTKAPDEFLADKGMSEEYEFNAHGSTFLQTEWERICAGRAQTPLDTSAYKVSPPPDSERGSLEAWQKAVDNAYSQLEHTNTRLMNLELMTKFGPNAWKLHTEQLQSFKSSLENGLKDCHQEIENLNRKRKSEQLSTGAKLRQLEHKWATSIQQANEIEGVCHLLEKQVKRFKARAEKKGLIKPQPQMDTSDK